MGRLFKQGLPVTAKRSCQSVTVRSGSFLNGQIKPLRPTAGCQRAPGCFTEFVNYVKWLDRYVKKIN